VSSNLTSDSQWLAAHYNLMYVPPPSLITVPIMAFAAIVFLALAILYVFTRHVSTRRSALSRRRDCIAKLAVMASISLAIGVFVFLHDLRKILLIVGTTGDMPLYAVAGPLADTFPLLLYSIADVLLALTCILIVVARQAPAKP
jgi:hypothetical protein